MYKPIEVWVIRNKITGEYLQSPGGKNSWKKIGHAKNAWASIGSGYPYGGEDKTVELCDKYSVAPSIYQDKKSFPYFDEQDVWEVINICTDNLESHLGIRLKKAEESVDTVKMEYNVELVRRDSDHILADEVEDEEDLFVTLKDDQSYKFWRADEFFYMLNIKSFQVLEKEE